MQGRMRSIVDDHIDFVARTLQKAGVPAADLDDEIQRTFIVIARRLSDVELGAERSFLFQVAVNLASHARRKLARRREVLDDRTPERVESIATPENLTDRKEMRKLLDEVVGGMDEPLRDVFMLHEFEEMNLTQIAALLRIPRGTVASRLRRARAEFRKHVAAIEFAWDLGARGVAKDDTTAPPRRETSSALGRTLLRTGTSVVTPMATPGRTLAALGLAGR
jgi:RNA polymerase sigma-70 factor (ECF subfamily)